MSEVVIFNISENNSVARNKILAFRTFYNRNNYTCIDYNYYNKYKFFRSAVKFELLYFFLSSILILVDAFIFLCKNNFRIVVVSVGPFSLNIITTLNILFKNTEFILDVRDPWVYGFKENRPSVSFSPALRAVNSFFGVLENFSFKSSDTILYTNDKLMNLVRGQLSPKYYSRFHSLYNGFNLKIKSVDRSTLTHSWNLVVFGKFSEYSIDNSYMLVEVINRIDLPFQLMHFNKLEDDVLKSLGEGRYAYMGSVGYREGLMLISLNRIALINECEIWLI